MVRMRLGVFGVPCVSSYSTRSASLPVSVVIEVPQERLELSFHAPEARVLPLDDRGMTAPTVVIRISRYLLDHQVPAAINLLKRVRTFTRSLHTN